jgi:hypothetical protein
MAHCQVKVLILTVPGLFGNLKYQRFYYQTIKEKEEIQEGIPA